MASKKKDKGKAAASSAKQDILYGLFALCGSYVMASWAIDSGSIVVYGFTTAGLYYTVHFLRSAFRKKFLHDKSTRTRRATKAH